MKKRFLSFLIISFLFIGCLETTEGLTINENGSGIYTMEIDISGMFTMMEMMKAEDSTGGLEYRQIERILIQLFYFNHL